MLLVIKIGDMAVHYAAEVGSLEVVQCFVKDTAVGVDVRGAVS